MPNKTPNIGLHDWDPNDIPTMADFAADNRIVDAEISGLDKKVISPRIITPTWNKITLINGVTTQAGMEPEFCNVNGTVFVRGRVISNSLTLNLVFGNILPGFRPGKAVYKMMVAGTALASDAAFMYVDADGKIAFYGRPKTETSTYTFDISYLAER